MIKPKPGRQNTQIFTFLTGFNKQYFTYIVIVSDICVIFLAILALITSLFQPEPLTKVNFYFVVS